MEPLGTWSQEPLPASPVSSGSGNGNCSSGSYSIKGEFAASTVFITGASGYIGSVLLEQLLRTTDVATIYLLLRPRRGQNIQERADKLLQGALFHKVRDQPKLLSKVKVIGGDISLPGLGLSPADRAVLVSSVNFVIHCAADIRLEADIQETLTSNYEGTRTVLELAAAAQRLRGLVHISSSFVNMNMPKGSIIDEAVYPLRLGRQVVDVEQLAKEFLESPKGEANARAETYKQLWNFPNTYTLGKHMGEQLVTRYQSQLQLPVAIVRPSLTCAIAGEPYPGYVGNWAGPIGAAAAMAIGMFDSVDSVASQPTGVWDIVPCDLVASSILAAAAAVSAGTAAAISRMTSSGVVKGNSAERRIVLGHPHPLSAAPAPSSATQHSTPQQQQLLLARGIINGVDLIGKIQVRPAAGKGAAAGAQEGDVAPQQRDQQQQHSMTAAAVVDSNSSGSSSPKLLAGSNGSASSSDLLSSDAYATSSSRGSSIVDESLTTSVVGTKQAAQQQQRGGGMPLLIVHAATSSTYPLVLMESWNYMLEFLDAHPPPFRMTFSRIDRMTADFVPNPAQVMSARRRVGWKVWGLAGLMRLLGKDKEARKLEVGYDSFCIQNNSKTDRQLVFSTDALVALEAALDPAEASDYLLVWRPVTKRPGRGTSGAGAAAAAKQAAGSATGSCRNGSGMPLGRAEAALAPVAGDLTWKRYLATQMAGVYRAVFGVEVSQRQLPAAAAAAAARSGARQQPSEEQYIVHDFVRIR